MQAPARTAAQRIAIALEEQAEIAIEKKARDFACFRFRLPDEISATVVRVHKLDSSFGALMQAAQKRAVGA